MLYGLTEDGRRIRLAEEATSAGLVFLPPIGVVFVRFELRLPDNYVMSLEEAAENMIVDATEETRMSEEDEGDDDDIEVDAVGQKPRNNEGIIAGRERVAVEMLAAVAKNSGVHHTALARKIGITSPTLTKRLMRLMTQGFIEQRKDGKYTHYQLTEKGKKQLQD